MPQYRFEEIAINSTEKRKPTSDDRETYIGLEHLDNGRIYISKWGSKVDIIGDKLLMHKGDVLFARRNAYLKRAAIAPFDGLFSAHGMVLRPNTEVISERLFPFFISSEAFFDAAIRISVGSISPTVNWRELKEVVFTIPPLSEQAELADIFWAFSAAQQAYDKLVGTTEALVKSQFIEMFGDPVTNPMGWPVMQFNDFATIDAVMTTDYEKYADYPHIGIDSIEKDTGALLGYRTVKQDNVKSGKYIFTPHHIIYSKIRPNLNKVALPSFDGLCSADAYPLLANKENCTRIYLACVLRSDWFLDYIVPFSNRSNMPKVNRDQIAGFTWPLPPIELQVQYESFINKLDKSKFALQQNIERLEMCRNALMQKAFS